MSQYVDICERLCQCVDRQDRLFNRIRELVTGEYESTDGQKLSGKDWSASFVDAERRHRAAVKAKQEALEAYRTYIS